MPGDPDPEIDDDPPITEDPHPQPVDNLLTFGDSVGFDVTAVVFVRQRWGNVWVQKDELVCTQLNWAVSPTMPTATLVHRYGQARESNGTIHVRSKQYLSGYYVRIIVTCIDGERVWHGFVNDTADEPRGFVNRVDEELISHQDATGIQIFSCLGMVAALDRTPLLTTYFKANSANETPDFDQIRVALSAPHFNPRTNVARDSGNLGKERQIKNATTDTEDVPADVFIATTPPAYPATMPDPAREARLFLWSNLYGRTLLGDYWTPKTAAEYLVAYAGPRDHENFERIPVWIFDPDEQLPDWGQPELNCQAKTLKECLDELLNIKQSLGYWCWVCDATNRVIIQPFTTLESSLTIETGKVLPANSRRFDINIAADPASAYTVQQNVMSLANQVIILGSKRVAVTTLKVLSSGSQISSALANGWSSTDVTAFNTEFPNATNGTATQREKYNAQDALEQGRYHHLYRSFIFGTNWNFKVGSDWADAGSLVDLFVNDSLDVTGNYEDDDSRYLPYPLRMRVLNGLPLKAGVDYTAADAPAQHANSTKQFRETEVYGLSHGELFAGTMLGKPTIWSSRAKREILYDTNDPDYYLDVNPLPVDQGHGVNINVAGASQIILGGSSPAPHIPQLPANSLSVTVAIEDDRHVEMHWPETSSSVDGVLRRVFDFGDTYQLVEILDGCIVGIADNEFQKVEERYFIRDDRAVMQQIAKQLYNWYSVARNIVRIQSRRVTARIWPGQLISDLNPESTHSATCNCVITEVAIQLPIGTPLSPGKPSMSVVTSRGEVDLMFFQPRLKA